MAIRRYKQFIEFIGYENRKSESLVDVVISWGLKFRFRLIDMH